MVNCTVEQFRMLFEDPTLIRNILCFGTVDHGVSTLIDVLVAAHGIIEACEMSPPRTCCYREWEARLPVFRPPMISLYFHHTPSGAISSLNPEGEGVANPSTGEPPEEKDYLIQLLSQDSDGRCERLWSNFTDGAIMVIDAIEGLCIQGERQLQHLLEKKVKPVFFINKLDRLILELQMDGEECYQCLLQTISLLDVVTTHAGKRERNEGKNQGGRDQLKQEEEEDVSSPTFLVSHEAEIDLEEDGSGALKQNFWEWTSVLKDAVKENPSLLPVELQEHVCRFLVGGNPVDPIFGNVAFGSGLGRWGFTLQQFARLYAKKFGIDEKKMAQKLWGDNFYDSQNKKWKTTNHSGGEDLPPLKRCFAQFIYEPLQQISDAVMCEKEDKVQRILASIKITLTAEERELVPKKKLRTILHKWLPLEETIMEMAVMHLPSPRQAQKYRSGSGILSDAHLISSFTEQDAIRRCESHHSSGIGSSPSSPPSLVLLERWFPSSVVQATSIKKNGAAAQPFYICRVLSGTLRADHDGVNFRTMRSWLRQKNLGDMENKLVSTSTKNNDSVREYKTKAHRSNLKINLMMGRYQKQVPDVPAGGICLIQLPCMKSFDSHRDDGYACSREEEEEESDQINKERYSSSSTTTGSPDSSGSDLREFVRRLVRKHDSEESLEDLAAREEDGSKEASCVHYDEKIVLSTFQLNNENP